MIGNVRIT